MTTTQQRKDLAHIIKATVEFIQYGRVTKALFRAATFYLEFEVTMNELTKTPLGLAIAILDIMQTMAAKAKDLEVLEIYVRCMVGKDRHDVRTPMEFLGKLLEITKGKRDLLSAGLVEDWVKASKYKRVKGG